MGITLGDQNKVHMYYLLFITNNSFDYLINSHGQLEGYKWER